MVRPINSPSIPHPPQRPASSVTSPDATQEAAKPSQHAVGQQAKATMLLAVPGEELPKNIHGKVASAIARALPLDTIINLQDISVPAGDDGPEAGLPVEPVPEEPIVGDPVADEVVIEDPVAEIPVDDGAVETPVLTQLVDELALEIETIELPTAQAPLLDPELTDLVPDDQDAETI